MEIWIQFLTEVIYLGWKLAVIMSWVICEFKADLMVTHNLNYIQMWVKKAGGRVVVELISLLNLMKFQINKRTDMKSVMKAWASEGKADSHAAVYEKKVKWISELKARFSPSMPSSLPDQAVFQPRPKGGMQRATESELL